MKFINEFDDFGIIATSKDTKQTKPGPAFELAVEGAANARMSDLLDMWNRVSEAEDEHLLTGDQANMFFKKFLPVMRTKIESKYWEKARPNTGWWRFDSKEDKNEPPDKYSDTFSAVLANMEKSPAFNTKSNQVEAIQIAFQLAEDTNMSEIKDVKDRLEAANSIATRATNQLFRELMPAELSATPDEKFPDGTITAEPLVPLQKGPSLRSIKTLLDNPTPAKIKLYNEAFGADAAEHLLTIRFTAAGDAIQEENLRREVLRSEAEAVKVERERLQKEVVTARREGIVLLGKFKNGKISKDEFIKQSEALKE
jgi:hypothetical protein